MQRGAVVCMTTPAGVTGGGDGSGSEWVVDMRGGKRKGNPVRGGVGHCLKRTRKRNREERCGIRAG